MSATLGDVSRFEEDLTRRTGRPTRPSSLRGAARAAVLLRTGPRRCTRRSRNCWRPSRRPVYIVHFTQAAAMERAQALTSINICTRAEKDAIAELIGDFRFAARFGKQPVPATSGTASACTTRACCPSTAGWWSSSPRPGLLKVICGTDTLGVGVNVPIRTVAVHRTEQVRRRPGPACCSAREFHQIAGRAGRAGFDTVGNVVVQAPEHVVENERAARQGRRRPEEAAQGGPQEAAGGVRRLGRGRPSSG